LPSLLLYHSDSVTPAGRQHRRNLGQRIARGRCEPRVAPFADPARTENQRLDLINRDHQGRKHETRAQDVTEPWLALDERSPRLQRSDIAIERADADVELGRQSLPGDRPAMPAKHLDQLKQTLRPRQSAPPLPTHKPAR
jgi:hypothetical protein